MAQSGQTYTITGLRAVPKCPALPSGIKRMLSARGSSNPPQLVASSIWASNWPLQLSVKVACSKGACFKSKIANADRFKNAKWPIVAASVGGEEGFNNACRLKGVSWQTQMGILMKAAACMRCHCGRRLLPLGNISNAVAIGGGGSGFGGSYPGGGGGGGDGYGKFSTSTQAIGTGHDDASAPSFPGSDGIIILDVGGMSCGGCASSVKRILESQPEVALATVNLATETAIIQIIKDAIVTAELGEKLAKHLTSCGFNSAVRGRGKVASSLLQKRDERLARLKDSGKRLAVAWTLLAVCVLGHGCHFFGKALPSWLHFSHSVGFQMSLCLVALAGPGFKVLVDGWKSLIRRAPNMNTLVGLGATSSFAVSMVAAFMPTLGWQTFFEEPVMLLAFVLLGRAVEERAKLQTSSDMEALLDYLPKKARLLVGNDVEQSSSIEVPCDTVDVGDLVVVLPGDRVPVDGVVRGGKSTTDESSLTGEPLPVLKQAGDEVTAGTINHNGTLTVEAKRPGGETMIGDIVRMVEDAQTREAPIQRLVDKVAGNFCYGVMALSATTFSFWSTLGPQLFPSVIPAGKVLLVALQLACNVLVIACPCALGLATPTAVLVGTSLGARKGLLIRGGDILENLSSIDTIVFDKTGTLTVGKPVVTNVNVNPMANAFQIVVHSDADWAIKELLALASAVERNTTHPIGKAVVAAASAANCRPAMVEDRSFEQEPGSGASAIVDGKRVTVGTLEWVHRHGAHGDFPKLSEDLDGQTSVVVGIDEEIAGVISVVDKVREDAGETINRLHDMGISTFMLSGDKRLPALVVASQVGIENSKVYANTKPAEKAEIIKQLKIKNKNVAMVGDGINDAAALAQAHVGIAMASGVAAASDVASVVLMRDKIYQVVDAIQLSKMTRDKIKQNLWWAFMYNIVGLPVAAGVLLPSVNVMLTPSIAGALMGLSSIGVMANSLLLQWEYDIMSNSRRRSSSPHHKLQVQQVDMEKAIQPERPQQKLAH